MMEGGKENWVTNQEGKLNCQQHLVDLSEPLPKSYQIMNVLL